MAQMKKKTKIVATIGPVSEDEKTFTKMAKAGMNVARLNFSHGSHGEHLKRIRLARRVSKKIGRPIAILQDLSGPKIRIGEFAGGKIMLKKGSRFALTTKKTVGDEKRVFVNYKNLPKMVKRGDFIMLEDGSKRLEVVEVSGGDINCRVVVGGELKSKKGVNLPGVSLGISPLTAKDKKDLAFGLKNGVDFVALSFVRSHRDVAELKNFIARYKSKAKVLAKIETKEAVSNIDKIISESDAIMVARGDLGIEVSPAEVPLIQKEIIRKCNFAGKPVITATQMLESMIKNPTPTRAEAADIANAILDGTDAIMLSEETTLGVYPLFAVEMMANIAKKTEEFIPYKQILDSIDINHNPSVVDAVSASVGRIAFSLDAKLIVAFSESGFTSRMISRWKPKQPILALTPNKSTLNALALNFGVLSRLIPKIKTDEEMIKLAKKTAVKCGLAKKGDIIVVSAGIPFGRPGTTNLLLVQAI
jgi:pyruvate kinase